MTSPTPHPLLQQALVLHNRGRLQEAEAIYRQVLAANPNDAIALNLLGVIAHQSERYDDATQLLRRAIQINPSAPDFHANLGHALASTADAAGAEAAFNRALALNPQSIPALHGLSQLRRRQHRLDDAVRLMRTLLPIQPDPAPLWSELAQILGVQGKFAEAHDAHARALQLSPADPLIHNNLGVLLHMQRRYAAAVDAFRATIAHDASYVQARLNLAGSLIALGEVDEAIAEARDVLARRPNDFQLHSALLMALHYRSRDREMLYREHLTWAQQHAPAAANSVPPTVADRNPDRRLRIGYVSADFRTHSVAFFFERILMAHDRTAFEICCYSDAAHPDDLTRRLTRHADHWRDVAARTDEQFCAQVRADQIDILIDLAGHTAGNRLRAFATRPAPIQVTYLGYPNTTAVSAINYRFTDAIADPPGDADRFHTEKLIRLPRCAWCYRPPDLSPHPNALPARESKTITFGSFNVLAKLSDDILDVWSRLLAALPNSRLMLKSAALGEEPTRQRLLAAFASRNVASDRLILRGHEESLKHHLRTYHEIDIALDTFPYSGTTTTCDALWMGVPVLSLVGQAHVSRVGASLLHAVGLEDLATNSPDQLIQTAAALAADIPRLAKIRSTLRGVMQKSPLMDGEGLAREIERAYREMWRRHVA